MSFEGCDESNSVNIKDNICLLLQETVQKKMLFKPAVILHLQQSEPVDK